MPLRRQELETFREQMEALKTDTSSRLIIICGAGVTRARVPVEDEKKFSWSGLIKQGLLEVQKKTPLPTEIAKFIESEETYPTEQLLVFASFIQNNLEKNQYANWLRNNVGNAVRWGDDNSNKQVLLKALVECAEIEKVGLATTNYDYLLSRAQGWTPSKGEGPFKPINWLETGVLSSWSRGTPECRQKVLHLHGDALDADSVIFSKEDYERLNTNNWTDKIRSVLTLNHVVLFVGCGATLEDPAFKKILDLYEENIGANRFNQRWFKLASSREDVPIGVNKLTYGDEHHHLPIFVRDILLPLLKANLAKTEIIENNQAPLQVPTQIKQTENVTDFGNNQNPPTSMVAQHSQAPISTDVQNAESDLLKKSINSIFSNLETADQNLLMEILTPDRQNENAKDKFESWLKETSYIDRIADIQINWNTFKQVGEKFWSNIQAFVMLLAIHAYVKRYNNEGFDLFDKYVKDFDNCILPIMVVVNAKYGLGCSLELVDGKWLSNNVIRQSTMQPAEAYDGFKIHPIMIELSPLMLDEKNCGSDDELMQENIKKFEKIRLAKPCLILDAAHEISEIQKNKFNEWGLTPIYPRQDLDEQLQLKFELMLRHLNSLSPVLKQSAVDNLKQNQPQLLSLIQKAEEKSQLIELIETLKQDPNLNKPESKSKADQVYKLIERIKTSAETVPAVAAALPILKELTKQIHNLIK